MRSPSLQRIRSEIDAEGHPSLSWEVMGRMESRLIASLLVAVALIWAWVGHSMPVEFWGLLQAKEPGGPDWLGLAITGAGSVFFCFFPIAAVVAAFRIAFRPQPERLTLKPGKLVCDAGSAGLLTAGRERGGMPLWRVLLGKANYEVAMEDFSGAFLGTFKGLQFVVLQAGPRQVWIGRWLQGTEQEQLVRTLTDWKRMR
jgi:hypothetical protein